jgi:hypothetical protein
VTVDGARSCRVAVQTNNVEADERGLIYVADRANTGLHIVRLTGEAARIDQGQWGPEVAPRFPTPRRRARRARDRQGPMSLDGLTPPAAGRGP